MDTIYLILSLPPLFLALYTITQHFLHKFLNFPPTPFPILPLIGHIYFFTKSTPFHRALSKLSRCHGPVLSLQLGSWPILLVSSPLAAQQCLTQNDIVFANRPNLLNGKHFGYNFTSLAWASYGDHWRNLRRISALELLSFHKLEILSGFRADEAQTLIHKLLRHHNVSNKGVDMRALFFEYAYNVVVRMITGRLGIDNPEEAEMFREIVAEMAAVTLEANVVDFLPFVGWFGFGDYIERKLSLVQEKRERFMENVIKEHCWEEEGDGGGKKKRLIEVLFDLQRAEPEYYTDETIRNLLLVLVQGASHTSSTTLEWAFSLLLQNPDILTKARSEIDNLVGKHRLIAESDVSKIPYLLNIINETLRMHPAAPLLTPHLSSDECIVGGFRVPHGTMLLVNAWDIQNNPQYWNDPEKFKPERFEVLEGGKNEFKFFPFGRGRRGCPGENLAMHMVGLALGSLIQCFEWEKVGEIDMREGKGIITPRVQPLRAKCIPRPFVIYISRKQKRGLMAEFQDMLPFMADKLGGEGLIGEMCKGFNLLMDREKGLITFESLKKNSALLGLQDLRDDELQGMLMEGDLNGDGALDEMEFCVLMFRLSPELMQQSEALLEIALQQEFEAACFDRKK
ncbi:hypothetical protein DH2020_011498 [Rehmannia glutinosa]|uniref:EF-hand domain-containing protein n=1 Tax=Rehmannia glutinosa TaxID=99300 RepID=A0ABR0XDT9_REHGL